MRCSSKTLFLSHDSSFPLLVERFSFLSAFPRRVRGPKNCLFPKKGGAD